MGLLGGDGEVELPEHFVVETQFRSADKMGVYSGRWKYFDNRDGHSGLPRRELQVLGAPENGTRTDVGERHPEVLAELAAYLEAWEKRHPRAPETPGLGRDPREIEQLRSLGYLR